jgi:hypothetical protein
MSVDFLIDFIRFGSFCMKKLSAIFFLFLFISITELKELYRVPLLIEHFMKHKNENGSMSMIDFLKLHYVGEKQNDNDDQEDQQLPFKTVYENTGSSFFSGEHYFITGTIVSQKVPFYNNIYSAKVPVNFGNSLFRPPRLA